MALRFLLDTNVVSELTKAQPNAGVLRMLAQVDADCALGAPTMEALTFGCHRLQPGTRQDALLQWLHGLPAQLPVLPFDVAAARWLGQERARLANAGSPAPRVDGELAAIAVVNGLKLVTGDLRDFTAFSDLHVVDWHV